MNAIIECPQGSKTKYELSKIANVILLDRPLHSSVMYPHDYGLIPGTLSPDDDPLDILVLSTTSTVPLTIVQCRPIGVLKMTDEKGLDEKILAVSLSDPIYGEFNNLKEIPIHYLNEITEFFRTYKNLEEPKYSKIKEWGDIHEAHAIIKQAIEDFKREYGEVDQINPF